MSDSVVEDYKESKRSKMDTDVDDKQDYFNWLPTELIEYIIKEWLSDFRDYCALSQVSRKFKIILDRLWKGYVQKRWRGWCDTLSNDVNWYKVCKECCQCESSMLSELTRLSMAGYNLNLLDEQQLRPFAKLPHQLELIHFMLTDILDKPLCEANLIHQHYAHYAHEYLMHQQLIVEWKSFFALPEEDQDWETGAILLAQWMQATQKIDGTMVTHQLDEIATAVGTHLLQANGGMTGSHDVLSAVKELSLPSLVILEAINNVLYNQYKFTGSGDDYYNPLNSYINKVLETRKGIPITLCCVYAAVAKRFGLRLEPVNNPGHFLLKLPNDKDEAETTYIDAYDRGRQIRQTSSNSGHRLSLSSVYFRMLTNLLQIFGYMTPARTWDSSINRWSTIPLCSVISLQWEMVSAAKLSRLPNALEMSMHFSIHHRYYVFRIVEIAKSLNLGQRENIEAILEATEDWNTNDDEIKKKPRAPEMLWYVGMVMKHVKYHYRCVICGRDEVCKLSKDWQRQMGVSREAAEMPFYNVLVEDSSNRYAAQENLQPCPQNELVPIQHWQVSKYFHKWTGKMYLPGDTLRKCYPEDDSYLKTQL